MHDRTSAPRRQWLEQLTRRLAVMFEDHGHPLPRALRVGTQFKGVRLGRTTMGRCYHPNETPDGHAWVVIHPCIEDPVFVAEILVHELAHAALGPGIGHGPAFKRLGRALGLVGPMSCSRAGESLLQLLQAPLAELGPYPGEAEAY